MASQNPHHKSWTTAITFAEAGEWQTAQSYLPATRRSRILAWLERMGMAVAFAEAGLPAEAQRYAEPQTALSPSPGRNFLELCGLDQVHLTYMVMSPLTLDRDF